VVGAAARAGVGRQAYAEEGDQDEGVGIRFHSVMGFASNGGGRPGGVGRWWCDGRIHLLLRPRLCRWTGGRRQRRRGLGERTRRCF
jgi:hypothetical protein